MKLFGIKASALFAMALAVVMSCADEEKITPESPSIETHENEIMLSPDPDFVAPDYGEVNARIAGEKTIQIKSITVYLARTSNATEGTLRIKVIDESTETSLQSGTFNVRQLKSWNGDLSNPQYTVLSLPMPAALQHDATKTYRLQVQCSNCSTDPSKEVVWWSANDRVYPFGEGKHNRGGIWTSHNNDFAFKITNVNSDGTTHVSCEQALKQRVYKLNTGDIQAQTYKPEVGNSYIIPFPDNNLANAFRQAAGIVGNGPITYGAVRYLRQLVQWNTISDLEGLQYADSLVRLYVRTSATTLTPIKKIINLTEVTLDGYRGTDITPLSSLTKLTRLDLAAGEITNVDALRGLGRLTQLSLNAPKVTNITGLEELSRLTNVYVQSEELSDITPLEQLTSLTTLQLSCARVTDISAVAALRNLDRFILTPIADEGSQLRNIAPLSGLTQLTQVEIRNTQVSDITPLSGLVNVTFMDLSFNAIANLPSLNRLTQLKGLSLEGNQITSVATLARDLQHITTLDLSDNPLTQQQVDVLRQQMPNTDIEF